jgi:hypothetical protein
MFPSPLHQLGRSEWKSLLLLFSRFFGTAASSHHQSKGRDFGLFWTYGVLLFPIALLHAAIMRAEEGSRIARGHAVHTRKCPFCSEAIRREAIVCRHCGHDVKPIVEEVYHQDRVASTA